jgi:Fe-S-cluster containining protein
MPDTSTHTLEDALQTLRKTHISLGQRFSAWWRRQRQARLRDHTGGLVPNCQACTDHCCKAPHDVFLRLSDIARLRDAGHGAAIVPPAVGGLALYAEPTLAKDDYGVCVFFSEGRCTIYALRPLVCQRFPYFIAPNENTLAYASSCQSRAPGDGATRGALRDAAIASFDARASDAALVKRARSALVSLGLLAVSRFAAVLAKKG